VSERLIAGEDPACVTACPTHALSLLNRRYSGGKTKEIEQENKITEEKDNGCHKK